MMLAEYIRRSIRSFNVISFPQSQLSNRIAIKASASLLKFASSHLYADPPNYKMAWRAMLLAVEGLFGLKFPHARLTPEEILRRLLPAVESAYKTNSNSTKGHASDLDMFSRMGRSFS